MTAQFPFKDLVICVHGGVTLLQEADARLFRAVESSLAKSRVLMGTEPVRMGFLSVRTQTHSHCSTFRKSYWVRKKVSRERERERDLRRKWDVIYELYIHTETMISFRGEPTHNPPLPPDSSQPLGLHLLLTDENKLWQLYEVLALQHFHLLCLFLCRHRWRRKAEREEQKMEGDPSLPPY